MCRSSRWRPRGRNSFVVKSSCFVQSSTIGRPKKLLRPLVHLRRDLFGGRHEHRIAVDGQLEVPLVVQRHRRQLAQRVLAVEHPAVRAGQQRVGDVADAVVGGRIRPRRRPGALDPLTTKVCGDVAADEAAGARVGDRDARPRDDGLRVEEGDPLAISGSRETPIDPGRHHGLPIGVQGSKRLEGVQRFPGEDVLVCPLEAASDLQRGHR